MADVMHDAVADRIISQAVGEELRRVRDQLGLSRGAVVERMSSEISAQALANYEYGIRPCSVARLVNICRALDVSVLDILGLALQRADRALSDGVLVDLHALIQDRQPELRPLRRWGRRRLDDDPNGPGVVSVERTLIDEMAALLGFSRSELVGHLVRFTPEAAPRR